MRSLLGTSTLMLAGVAVVLAVLTYLKDPGLPILGAKNSFPMLGFVIPRMVVAILLAGLMQGPAFPVSAGWLVSVFNHHE